MAIYSLMSLPETVWGSRVRVDLDGTIPALFGYAAEGILTDRNGTPVLETDTGLGMTLSPWDKITTLDDDESEILPL